MKTINQFLSYVSIAIILLSLSQCKKKSHTVVNTSDKSEIQDAIVSEDDLIGSWKNLSMKVTFLDKDTVFYVPEGQWENILKIKPIITKYNADGSFKSSYYALVDTLLFENKGRWKLVKDSIYLTSDGETTAYLFTRDGETGSFTGMLDWDADGLVNELYMGKQIKISQ